MMKSGMSMLLSLFFVTALVSACSAYDPPEREDRSDRGDYEPSDYQGRSYDSPPPVGEVGRLPHHDYLRDEPPPAGEVGPAPSHGQDHHDHDDDMPPPPSGAVGPARYR